MKGKTNQPITVAVAQEWATHPAILALAASGHSIVSQDFAAFDLILAPAAHGWNDELWDDIDVALKAARKRKKERK